MLDKLRNLYRREPARVIAVAVAAIVGLASAFGIVVDEQGAGQVVAIVLSILLGGEATRAKVTPAR